MSILPNLEQPQQRTLLSGKREGGGERKKERKRKRKRKRKKKRKTKRERSDNKNCWQCRLAQQVTLAVLPKQY
jgi:hypothetical protein